jgi:hypothetical protein
VFIEEFIEQFVELGGVFFFQDQGVGEPTVTGAVPGRIALSLRGEGSFGSGSLDAGDGDLFGSSDCVGRISLGSKDFARFSGEVIEERGE